MPTRDESRERMHRQQRGRSEGVELPMTTTNTHPKTEVMISWMVRSNMPEVLEIELASFHSAWTEDEFIEALKQRNCIGMVAKRADRVVGFMIYELLKSRLHVLNFAVHPEFRRQQVGTQMVDKLLSKLSQQRRTEIILEVRERNLAAQKFFSAQGFWAERVLREHYDETGEDAYQFVRKHDE